MTNGYLTLLRLNLETSINAKRKILADEAQLNIFASAAERLVACYRDGGRLYIAGNGGSAGDAQHLAAEFVSKQSIVRAALPAEALTTDTSALTAIGNDFGYDQLFVRQIEAKVQKNDMFLALSTSGKSPNILRALEKCREMKIPTILFCGRDGGEAKSLADYCVTAPGEQTSTIQETHILLCHTLCECVEAALFS
jgi:D-sedoheptulose 7-phosphate isomerase